MFDDKLTIRNSKSYFFYKIRDDCDSTVLDSVCTARTHAFSPYNQEVYNIFCDKTTNSSCSVKSSYEEKICNWAHYSISNPQVESLLLMVLDAYFNYLPYLVLTPFYIEIKFFSNKICIKYSTAILRTNNNRFTPRYFC